MDNMNEDPSATLVFDYISIRRFIGLIAIFLPLAVIVAAWDFPGSISASYHASTGFPILAYFPSPRDIFVGTLFVIGAFLMSYKGHQYEPGPDEVEKFFHKLGPNAVRFRIWERKNEEDIVSWIGGISAWIVALFPTANEPECAQALLFSFESDMVKTTQTVSTIHLSFAALLFLTTVYFSLAAFKRRLNEKIEERGPAGPWYADPLKRRRFIYDLSGWTTLLLIAGLGVLGLVLDKGVCVIEDQTYWAETVMLELFGAAWFTASKPPFLRDPSEKGASNNATSE
jgi:hypothetical protein